jgi:PadR family transcriptional regulator, regulatory protein PadR
MTGRQLRVTAAVATVLRVFLDDPREPRYGYELMRLTEFPSGKMYPILARLEAAGWLDRRWESIDPVREGRPARCWYRLSEEGVAAARQELAARGQRPISYRRLRPAWQTGGGRP